LGKADRCPVSNRKRDIEGSVESVAEEVASFGSDVTIIEPGGARIAKLMPIDTQIPAHSFLRMVGPKNGLTPGDPDQMPARINKRVNVEPPPLRLVLGSQALEGTLMTPCANTMPASNHRPNSPLRRTFRPERDMWKLAKSLSGTIVA
jgi:hypothetical protein